MMKAMCSTSAGVYCTVSFRKASCAFIYHDINIDPLSPMTHHHASSISHPFCFALSLPHCALSPPARLRLSLPVLATAARLHCVYPCNIIIALPRVVVPAPLQTLCLDCILQVAEQCQLDRTGATVERQWFR